MNSFSCFLSSMIKKTLNVNSFNSLTTYSKQISLGISGDSFRILSSTLQYSNTTVGININNNNSTYSFLTLSGNNLKTIDYVPNIANSFSIYCKYKCRSNILPILNFQYPNVVDLSLNENLLRVNFFSLLNPGTQVPYVISGVSSANLNGALTSGTLTTPMTQLIYTVTGGYGNTFTFNASGGILKSMQIPLPVLNFAYDRVTELNNATMISDPSNTFFMAISKSGINFAVTNVINTAYTLFISNNGLKTTTILTLINEVSRPSLTISDTTTNCIVGYSGINASGGTTFTLKGATKSLSTDGNGLPTITFSDASAGATQCLYGTNRGFFYLADISGTNSAVVRNGMNGVIQMASTTTFSYMLCSVYSNGEFAVPTSVSFLISSNQFQSFTTITGITSTGNGLVYVSKTGAFMAIGTNTGFYYSTNQFTSFTTITTGDYFKNFFKLNFSDFTMRTSNWFAYNESSRLSFFLKSEDGGVTSKLCVSSDFIASTYLSSPTVEVTRKTPFYQTHAEFSTKTQCLIVSSANAEKMLLYGNYNGTTGFYYVTTGQT